MCIETMFNLQKGIKTNQNNAKYCIEIKSK